MNTHKFNIHLCTQPIADIAKPQIATVFLAISFVSNRDDNIMLFIVIKYALRPLYFLHFLVYTCRSLTEEVVCERRKMPLY